MNNIAINEQNSIKIENIYIDPFNIKDESHDARLLLFTHSHYDHFSKKDYEKVSNDKTIFVMPTSMLNEEDFNNAKGLNINESITLDNITITGVPAYNEIKPFHPKRNNWLGYIIEFNNEVIYVCGDTDALKENESINCDTLIIPIGGTYTMNYKEAAEFTNKINPKRVIPSHYGTIVGNKKDAIKFKELINNNIIVEEKIHF